MTSMLQARVKNHLKSGERGVTLLLAVLILAAITAIVFTAAAIAVNQVRVGGDLIKSEPAITAAEAGTEDLLYYAVRGVGSYSTNCAAPTVSTILSITVNSCLNPYLADPYQFSLASNGEKDFYLYNAVTQGGAPGYTNISVTLTSGISATVDICSWTSTTCIGSPDVATLNLSTGQTQSAVLNASASIGYQVIFLNNVGSTGDTFTVTTTPNGMPSGTATLEVTGANNGVTRKIQTILPQ